MITNLRTTATVLLACLFTTTSASGAVKQRNVSLQVRGSVVADCRLSTAAVSFGPTGVGYLNAPGHVILAQSSMTVRCSKGATAQITMDRGLYSTFADSRFGSRAMKVATSADYLTYELCRDSGCAQVWTPAGYAYTSPSDAGSTLAVWGRLISAQHPAKLGTYSDSVTATINF